MPRKPTCRVRPKARGAALAPLGVVVPSCMVLSGVRSRPKVAVCVIGEGKAMRSCLGFGFGLGLGLGLGSGLGLGLGLGWGWG